MMDKEQTIISNTTWHDLIKHASEYRDITNKVCKRQIDDFINMMLIEINKTISDIATKGKNQIIVHFVSFNFTENDNEDELEFSWTKYSKLEPGLFEKIFSEKGYTVEKFNRRRPKDHFQISYVITW